jgi:hypothetical protein
MSLDKKNDIKTKLTHTRFELTDLAVGLTEAQWLSKAYTEDSEWRVIDIFRHIADSERGMTNLMIQIRQGGEGVPSDFDLDRWNQRAVAKLQDKSVEGLLADMATNRAALFSFIDSLEPEDWEKKGRHASLRVMSIEEICRLIADHEAMHLTVIRQSLGV